MSSTEKVFGIVKDVVLPVDERTWYDVYFTDRRVGIVCMGRAEREVETQGPLSVMPSAFGVPAPVSYGKNEKTESSIDDEVNGWSLDSLLKLSKKSCFYTLEEIEKVELVWGGKPKFIVLSRDCESKFAPTEEQLGQLIDIIPVVEGLKDKLWIAGKYSLLFGENQTTKSCIHCGAHNDYDATYCGSCGNRLEANPP